MAHTDRALQGELARRGFADSGTLNPLTDPRHFQPWYGRALARYLVAQYKLDLFPYHDLIIYEIGAGNGTLMGDVLDYLAAHEPEIYARTKYRIIEISERLQGMQRGRAKGTTAADAGGGGGGGDGGAGRLGKEKAKRRGHEDRVEIINSSIFEWDRVVPEPCFFLAMEVLVRFFACLLSLGDPVTDSSLFGAAQDNLSHDVVRYTTDTYEPLQCVVSVDATGDYTELYEPVSDPLLARYLSLRSRLPSSRARSHPSRAIPPLLAKFPFLRRLYATIPFAPNLTRPEFVPTRQLELLEILRDKFPNHRLLMSDFETLPDAIEGVNAPVVQTRYAGEVGLSQFLFGGGLERLTLFRPGRLSRARLTWSSRAFSTSFSRPTFTPWPRCTRSSWPATGEVASGTTSDIFLPGPHSEEAPGPMQPIRAQEGDEERWR